MTKLFAGRNFFSQVFFLLFLFNLKVEQTEEDIKLFRLSGAFIWQLFMHEIFSFLSLQIKIESRLREISSKKLANPLKYWQIMKINNFLTWRKQIWWKWFPWRKQINQIKRHKFSMFSVFWWTFVKFLTDTNR